VGRLRRAELSRLWEDITKGIVADLERGSVTRWRSPWQGGDHPMNLATGRMYLGELNTLILSCAQTQYGYRTAQWLTARQAVTLGGWVKRGARPTTVLFGKPGNNSGQRGMGRLIPVFNVDQIGGLPPGPKLSDPSWSWSFPRVERLIGAIGMDFRIGGTQAYWHRAQDYIRVPPANLFYQPSDWLRTALHEICHSTAHPSRLNRKPRADSWHVAQAIEEILVEMATTYLLEHLRLYSTHSASSYIAAWLRYAKADSHRPYGGC